MSSTPTLKDRLLTVGREFVQQDLRYSYYVAAGLILLGAIVNLTLAHGWTVWPFVFVASFMTMVHEAAERSGQGVPPLYVYAGFVSMLTLWVIGAVIFSALPPIVLLIGAIAIIYQCAKGYILQHQRSALVATRRANGLCVHCGEAFKVNQLECPNCGNEPNPEGIRLSRVSAVVSNRKNTARARSTIGRQSANAGVAQKEQALIARRHAAQHRKH
jgi:hypothetical protein